MSHPGRKSTKRQLSAEDVESWSRVTATTKALPRSKPAQPHNERLPLRTSEDPESPRPPHTPAGTHLRLSSAPAPSGRWETNVDRIPDISVRLAAAPLRMDSKTFSRMKRGKVRPERKIDLHGMTLAQAHPTLIRFIQEAYGSGLRLVLVVTGKGNNSRDDGGPIPVPRGLLRHHVPGWLHAMPLRPLVLQVTDAHVRHGGAGAYYVYLRRGG